MGDESFAGLNPLLGGPLPTGPDRWISGYQFYRKTGIWDGFGSVKWYLGNFWFLIGKAKIRFVLNPKSALIINEIFRKYLFD